MIAVGCLTVLLAAVLVVLDRRDRRAHEDRQAARLENAGLVALLIQERDKQRVDVASLVDRLEQAEARNQRERSALLQRIQAPEVAVQEHATLVPVQMPQAVNPADDEDFWKAKADQDDAIARMEALEREGIT